ncbi:hypothetical protein A2Z33_01290 [Candidatus Gottesmanbacteria bacterium RBG_16_52_11]|uniref:Zinc finger DksA/TraR C4-type domain-containing protein n=1 Tax=Candidatus Gottesmanbacteria bacterium RBG_16_52_11 TaxID=1798374 RepID=A0A1F5YNS4_9BACT|nr:MAG: hypothetical protein A2Z33_01290 [Candidatus Gottesmanbacteria bacterium RBG_16_52_11]
MHHLPDGFVAGIRTQLESDKSRFTLRIGELKLQDPFTNTDRVNDNAALDLEADEESAHDRTTALIGELKYKITEIDTALSRIAQGIYGICVSCGKAIDTDRLRAMPTAVLCRQCAAGKENKP